MYEEFIKALDVFVKKDYHQLIDDMKEWKTKLIKFSFIVETDKETKEKFGLNDDISFMVTINNQGGGVDYLYKGIPIAPKAYYLRPDDYHEVSTLRMIQEAIKQDKHNPDIKYLERGETEMKE